MKKRNETLVIFFLGMYSKNKKTLEFLIDGAVPKKIFLSEYYSFIEDEIIFPIELLLKEEKQNLVSKCRETGLSFNNERLRDAARVLYMIEFFNRNT